MLRRGKLLAFAIAAIASLAAHVVATLARTRVRIGALRLLLWLRRLPFGPRRLGARCSAFRLRVSTFGLPVTLRPLALRFTSCLTCYVALLVLALTRLGSIALSRFERARLLLLLLLLLLLRTLRLASDVALTLLLALLIRPIR